MPGSRIVVAAFLLLVAAACQPAASRSPTSSQTPAAVPATSPTPSASVPVSSPAEVIAFTVSVTGGECPNGPCGAEYVVHGDGRVDGPDDALRAIPSDQMDRIADAVGRTNWDVVRSVPFTSMCPTAYDGQKRVYAFPARGGEVVLDSCEFDLSRVPVIQAIDGALFGG